ncbi:hypothetical protein D3C81_1026110 [compost metagenome]
MTWRKWWAIKGMILSGFSAGYFFNDQFTVAYVLFALSFINLMMLKVIKMIFAPLLMLYLIYNGPK